MKNLYTVTTYYDEDKNPPETKFYLAETIADVQSETQYERYHGEWLLQSETADEVVYNNSFYWLTQGRCKMVITKQDYDEIA